MYNEGHMKAFGFDDFTTEELNAAISFSGMSRKAIATKLNCHPSYITMMVSGRGLPSAEKKTIFVAILSEHLERVYRSRSS
jgi:ribosome-binding protein aMBF1 (putative translation factor)